MHKLRTDMPDGKLLRQERLIRCMHDFDKRPPTFVRLYEYTSSFSILKRTDTAFCNGGHIFLRSGHTISSSCSEKWNDPIDRSAIVIGSSKVTKYGISTND